MSTNAADQPVTDSTPASSDTPNVTVAPSLPPKLAAALDAAGGELISDEYELRRPVRSSIWTSRAPDDIEKIRKFPQPALEQVKRGEAEEVDFVALRERLHREAKLSPARETNTP